MADFSRLSLFTRNHTDHDPEWTLQGARQDSLICMPCVVEMLEDSDELPVRKKFILGELLQMTGSTNRMLLEMLADNQRLAWHIVQTLYELLDIHHEDSNITDVVVELVVQLCCQLQCEELVCCLLHQISIQVSKDVTFQHCLPSLSLLGQLLNNIPALADVLIQTQDTLLTYVISCLDAKEENIKIATVYALLKVLSSREQKMAVPMYGQLANRMMGLLSVAERKELQQKSMELLGLLLDNDEVTRGLMHQGNKTSLPSALKKMLMSRDITLKVTSIQCVQQILTQDKLTEEITHYSDDLLDADIAEFLFEALATADGNLLSYAFGCLLLFTECQSFFTKCHTVYGIESIVRALHHCIKLNNTEALQKGLKLLSDILERQPEDIHLLNGLGIHKQINSLLHTCLKHSDIGIQIHTSCALKHMLRKHHLPKLIDYSSIIALLQTLQESMERLPRPITKTSSRHHRRHRKTSKDATTDSGSPKEEVLLLCGFDVFEQAFSLAVDLMADPVTDGHVEMMMSASNTNQTGNKSTLKDMQYYLMRFLDSTCIPIFMVNYTELSDPAGFTGLFHMLCLAFKFNIDLKNFAQKIAGCSFVQFSIDVKNKITNTERESTACEVINAFLVEFCMKLLDLSQSDGKEMQQILQQGLSHLKGSCDDLLSMLCNQKLTIPSLRSRKTGGDIDETQQAVLALLYVAFLHSDRLVSEVDLEESLDIFMSTIQDFKSLSLMTRKHLLFLHAVCFCANNSGNRLQTSNVQRFHEHLSAEDLPSLYSHHPVLFHWCCASDAIPIEVTKALFRMWICNLGDHLDAGTTMENASEDVKITLEMMQTNHKSLSMMMDFLYCGDEDISEKASWLIKSVLNQPSPNGSSLIVQVLQDQLPDVMQKLFLGEEQEVKDVNCIALLDLLCCVHMRCHIPEMESISAKLAYHVCNLLSKESTTNTELVRVSLNYLTCLMIQNDKNADNRVALVILSSSGILQMLEELLQTEEKPLMHANAMDTLQAAALSLLAQLIDVQRKTNIKVQYQISMDLASAMSLIQKSTKTCIRVSGTKLWSFLLMGNCNSPVLRIHGDRDERVLIDDEDVGLGISASHLRKLLVILQNNMLKGDDILCAASVHCLHALMVYTNQKNKDLGKHLLNQPWNQLLLSQCLDLCSSDEGMMTGVLEFVNLFLKFDSDGTVVNQAMVDTVLERVVKYQQRESSSGPISTISCKYIALIEQVLNQDNLRISMRLREKIVSQMKTVTEYPDSDCDTNVLSPILSMQGVILAPISPEISVQEMKSAASKIHTALKSTI